MLNNLSIMGRLTSNPEIRQTPKGYKVCNFSIAVQRPKRKDSEPEADFFHCVAWNGSAEIIQKYFDKGSMIAIQGRLRNSAYLKNSEKRIVTQIIVEKIFFTGEHRKDSVADSSPLPNDEYSEISEYSDEEIDTILSDEGVPF